MTSEPLIPVASAATRDRRDGAAAPAGALSSGNIVELVLRHCAARGSQAALITPASGGGDNPDGLATAEPDVLSFQELERRVSALAAGLRRSGLRPGDRAAVLIQPGPDFAAIVIALLAAGMVPVLLDGRLGRERAKDALRTSRVRAVFARPETLRWWPAVRSLWRARRFSVGGSCFGAKPIEVLELVPEPLSMTAVDGNDVAIMSFTSGSTGRAKAIRRTHGVLLAQHRAIDTSFPSRAGSTDMSCFPLVALHMLCCGVTSVSVPSAIAEAVEALLLYEVRSLRAAPAFASELCAELERRDMRLLSLESIQIGGGPVSASLAKRVIDRCPRAAAYAVYGCTEAEPIASVPLAELARSEGGGFLAGYPVAGASVRVVRLGLLPATVGEAGIAPLHAASGEVGEVVVCGAHVDQGDETVPGSKIRAADGSVWHRTGDAGRWDERGRLWLVGRTTDALNTSRGTVFPYPVEAAAGSIRGIRQAAVSQHITTGDVAVAVRLAPSPGREWAPELRALLAEHGLAVADIHVTAEIPCDARHGSKVDRLALRRLLFDSAVR